MAAIFSSLILSESEGLYAHLDKVDIIISFQARR
jgi:hypothetical protein